MELKRLLSLLEEKLDKHDNYMKEIQNKVQEIYTEITDEVTSLENKIKKESIDSFSSLEKRINDLIEKLDDKGGIINTSLIEKAQKELSCEYNFEIRQLKRAASFSESYKFKYTKLPVTKKIRFNDEDNTEIGLLIDQLSERIKKIKESNAAINKSINEICLSRRSEARELKSKMLEELEKYYIQEKERIQEVVTQLKKGIDTQTPEELKELKIEAISTLVKNQKYSLRGPSKKSLIDYSIDSTEDFSLKWLSFEERKPFNVVASFTNNGKLSLSFTFFDDDEIKALEILHPPFKVTINIWEKNRSKYNTSEKFTKEYTIGKRLYFSESFKPNTRYCLEVRIEQSDLYTKWSDETTEFTTPEFKECSWKECPYDASDDRKYIIDENNPRVIKKVRDGYCTVTGNITLPFNKVTSWSIKILKTKDAYGLHIGVAPFNTEHTANDNFEKCGWYFYCCYLALYSGPPHNYNGKKYEPRICKEKHVYTGDSVGVAMDTTKGDLSFIVNEVNLGVAYEGIPLDKPLVPCVLFYNRSDSVELITSEVKETKLDSSIHVPFSVTAKSDTWDTITLKWDDDDDDADGVTFYQIEVDGSEVLNSTWMNTFTMKRLLPDTMYSFRVRIVRESSVGEWSDAVKARTLKWENYCTWERCLCSDDNKKYSLSEKNSRIATNVSGYGYSIITGNTFFPPNKVISWNIKILKSQGNSGNGIYIGVAPFDINRYDSLNFEGCGWYFSCYNSKLYSGPPHKYNNREYGIRRKESGQYVHARDNVGVVMNTAKGELSFIVNKANLGVAFEGIPLDKPLVPCVVLSNKDDSVELIPSNVKENVDSSVPYNITAKSDTWDTITLTWDAVEGASFYQIEVDESKTRDVSKINTFTKKRLLPSTEHSFRVRAVRGNPACKWSDVVKRRTMKKSFETSGWKECPDNVEDKKKYSLNEKNTRIAIKNNGYGYSIITGNTSIPPNKESSWSIKILKSQENGGNGIYAGVAPSDINQNESLNFEGCGWYFYCYDSTLFSGPPHNYRNKEYGLRKKENRQYIHTGDSVGVVMDTAKGELSFFANGMNYDTAYEGIPLDKPLVPCVLLYHKDDSVELII